MGNSNTSSKDGGNKGSSKFRGKPSISIKTFTWTRDSHGLFDYESKTITKKNLKTSNPGRIFRQGNEIRLSKENDKTTIKDEKELLRMMVRDGEVYVDNCREDKESLNKRDQNVENTDDDLWLVVKSMKTNANSRGYQLTEGDLIKLGRVKFRVREFRGGAAKPNKAVGQTKIEDDNLSVVESDKKEDVPHKGSINSISSQTCRICLSETPEPGDPFFSPCHCTGTMKYIHVKCLQRWLKSKLHTKVSANSNSVYWKTLECELCKTPYPTFFVVEEKRYDIVEFDRPDCPYIILDILSKDKGITRGIHVIKMENKNNIRLGRAHDSDIRITDISVSRCHAFIKLEKGNFYLDDNNSKFGTLIHLKKAFNVPMDITDVSLQVGRTVVSLTVKKGRRFLPACFGGATNKNNVSRSDQDSDSEVEEEESENEHEGEEGQEVHSPVNASNVDQSVRNQRRTSLNNNNSPISNRAANQIQDQEPEEESGNNENDHENDNENEDLEQEQGPEEQQQEEEEEQHVQDLELPVADAQEDNESDGSAGLNNNNNIHLQVNDQNVNDIHAHNVAGSMTLNHNGQGVQHLSNIEDGPVD